MKKNTKNTKNTKSTKNKRIPIFGNLKTLATAAMLAAISAVIGIICKNFFTFNIYYRVTFENLPVIFSGIVFGPFVGAAVGIVADIVSCLCSSNPSLNPLITAGAAFVGLASGIVARWIIKRRGGLQIALSVATAHLIGQVIIKSIAKMIWFGMPKEGVLLGLGISLVVGTLEFFAIKYLLSRKVIVSQLEVMK